MAELSLPSQFQLGEQQPAPAQGYRSIFPLNT
jgi:hypothetical protein